jgi:hypothetical protein
LNYRYIAAALFAAYAVLQSGPSPAQTYLDRSRRRAPKDVVAKANDDVNRVLDDPDMERRTATMGFRLFGGPPENLESMLKSEITKWAENAKSAGMTGK